MTTFELQVERMDGTWHTVASYVDQDLRARIAFRDWNDPDFDGGYDRSRLVQDGVVINEYVPPEHDERP